MQGEQYPNACNPDEKQALFDTIFKKVETDARGAWRAVSTILCSPGTKANYFYIAGLMSASVRQHWSSTGRKDGRAIVARSDQLVQEILAIGSAWKVTLQIEPKKILHYFRNEACVDEVILSFVKRKWIISG